VDDEDLAQSKRPRKIDSASIFPPNALRGRTRLSGARVRGAQGATNPATSRAAEGDFPGEETRAARPVGEHERAGAVDARDGALHLLAIGQQQAHRLALIRMAALPFGGKRD